MATISLHLAGWALLSAGFFLSVSGCASMRGPVQQATVERDAEAKSFTRVPGKASLYIYRDQGYMGNEQITVDIGDWIGGRTVGKTFLLAVVEPGQCVVRARGDEKEELQIQVEGGEIYFIRIKVRPAPVTANASLHLVGDEAGKAAVLSCRRVELDDEPR